MGPPAVAPATTHAASPRHREGARFVGHRGGGAGVVRRRGATVAARAIDNLGRRGDNDRGEDVAKQTGSATNPGGLLRVVSQPVADTVATNPVVGLGLTAAVGVAAAVAASARRGGNDHHRGRHDAATAAAGRDDYVTFSFDDAVDVPLAAPNAVNAGNDDPVRDPRPNKPPPFPSLPDRSREENAVSVVVQQTPSNGRRRVTVASESVASEEEARFEAALASGGRSTDDATEDVESGAARVEENRRRRHRSGGTASGRIERRGFEPARGKGNPHASPAKMTRRAKTVTSKNNPWWDVDIDDVPYRAAPRTSKKPNDKSEARSRERRRANRRKNREAYLRNNQSVRRGSPGDRTRAAELVRQRLRPIGDAFEASPDPGSLTARLFDSRTVGAAAYGLALAALCREHALDAVAGEGTFSDVYATRRTEGVPRRVPRVPRRVPRARLDPPSARGEAARMTSTKRFGAAASPRSACPRC